MPVGLVYQQTDGSPAAHTIQVSNQYIQIFNLQTLTEFANVYPLHGCKLKVTESSGHLKQMALYKFLIIQKFHSEYLIYHDQ